MEFIDNMVKGLRGYWETAGLDNADVVIPLGVSLPDGKTLVYVGTGGSGEIKALDNNESYAGKNILIPSDLSEVSALRSLNGVVNDVSGQYMVNMDVKDFENPRVTMDQLAEIKETLTNILDSQGVQLAPPLDNHYSDPGEQREYEERDLAFKHTTSLIDRLNVIERLPEYSKDILTKLEADPRITPEQKYGIEKLVNGQFEPEPSLPDNGVNPNPDDQRELNDLVESLQTYKGP